MKIKYLLLIIFLLVTEHVGACVCFSLDSLTANDLTNEVGFVVIGHAVKNVGFNKEANDNWDQQNGGHNVLFEVDSVVKGNLNLKTIVINQFGDNCDRIFKFGKKYLIVGNQLETFVNKTPKRKKIKEGEIPPTSMPPPPPSVYSKTAIFYDGSDDEVRYWNNLAHEHVILNTSMCSSFLVNSKYASYFWAIDNRAKATAFPSHLV